MQEVNITNTIMGRQEACTAHDVPQADSKILVPW